MLTGVVLLPDARALFERSIAKVPADKARPLWEKWADHEYLFGDLAAIQKLDARMAEAFPEGEGALISVESADSPR